MEERFGHDFTRVRIHADAQAAASARSLNARAYTVGDEIVFGRSRYAPSTPTGRLLLAHELAHVVQGGGQLRGTPTSVEPAGSLTEANAAAAARAVISGRSVTLAPLSGPQPVFLDRDSRLERFLESFRRDAGAIVALPGDKARVRRILDHFRGVDLGDPDNLGPISDVVSRLMPEATLLSFLQVVETDRSVRRVAPEELQLQRTIRLAQVRRGAFGGFTAFPTTELLGATAEAAGRQLGQAVETALAFFGGVIAGMREAGNDDLVARLARRLIEASVLTVALPPVFASGALVGIGEDVWRAIRGVWELITNFRGMLEQFRELFGLLVSPTGPALARTMGRRVGMHWRAELGRMADYNAFRFTYEVGRLIGPTIVYAVLAILGIGVAEIASEIVTQFVQILERFPQVLRIIERIGGFFRRRPRNPFEGLTEREIEAALEHIETPRVTGGARPTIGGRRVPTRRLPRLDAGDIPARPGERLADVIERVRTIIGRRLSAYPEIQAAWNRAAARALAGEILTPANARSLYNRARRTFWSEVRRDPAALRRFTDAGFAFPQNVERAAQLGGVTAAVPASEITVSLDHVAEIGQGNWQRALDPTNLQLEFSAPNTFREIVQARHPALR